MSDPLADMPLLIMRLARALKKADPEHELPDKAVGYLVRKGLLKGPFRNETQGASK